MSRCVSRKLNLLQINWNIACKSVEITIDRFAISVFYWLINFWLLFRFANECNGIHLFLCSTHIINGRLLLIFFLLICRCVCTLFDILRSIVENDCEITIWTGLVLVCVHSFLLTILNFVPSGKVIFLWLKLMRSQIPPMKHWRRKIRYQVEFSIGPDLIYMTKLLTITEVCSLFVLKKKFKWETNENKLTFPSISSRWPRDIVSETDQQNAKLVKSV